MYWDTPLSTLYTVDVPRLAFSPNAALNMRRSFNPFNPTTSISSHLPKQSKVSLTLFGILGQEVESLVEIDQPPGRYTFSFNAKDLSSGVTFVKIDAGSFVATRTILLRR